jgi:RHS repeat-associated protein
MPDGSLSRVEFSPWYVKSYDPNDTAFNADPTQRSDWYRRRIDPTHPRFAEFNTVENARAAKAIEVHADTPALTILDSLGRDVISIAHNRVKDAANVLKDDRYLTFTKLDAEGKPLWIRDARKNLVMQYIRPSVLSNQAADPVEYVPCYDIAGNLLFQHSMDAGDRWMLNDAAGKPMCAWDNLDRAFRTDYDALHRPVGSFVKGANPAKPNQIIQFEKVIYGDTPGNGLSDVQKTQLNLRGKPYKHYDTAGLVVSLGRNPTTDVDEAFDFKGNPLRSTRKLIEKYQETPDWSQNQALEGEIFSSTRYDALNRPIQMVAPHIDKPGSKFNVIRPGYNEANLLERVDVWLSQTAEPTALLNPTTANLKAVTNIDYDAKGQRIRIEYNEANHPVITEYTYDRETFRLSRLLSTRPKHPEADKRTLQDLSYTYDPVGNITEIRDKAQQRVFFNNSLVDPSNTYTYDALYRLVLAEGREHAVQNNVQRDAEAFKTIAGIPFPNSPEALQNYTEAYKYDPVGNILEFRHTGGEVERWVRKYQYALDSNRLLATRLPGEATNLPDYAATPGYREIYTYDDHGNMKAMPHLKVMEWDFKDRLHATQQQVVNNGIGERTYFVYDAGGQRVRKVTETQNGTRKDERIYLGGFEVYRMYNGNGQKVVLERETLHVMDDKQRIALVETKTITNPDDKSPVQLIRFQLGNHLGSAALELDDKAQVISYEEYHPYGSTAYHAARSLTETPKRYRYTGKERDEETGFSYHGARYYAPWLGRWTAVDPVGIGAGVNFYLYSAASPVCLIDPDGLNPDHPENTGKHEIWQEGTSSPGNSSPPTTASSPAVSGQSAAPPPPTVLPEPGGPWDMDADRIVRRPFEAGAGPWKSPDEMKAKGNELAKKTGFDPTDRDLDHEAETPNWKQRAGDKGHVRNERAKGVGGNRSKGVTVERPASQAAKAKGEYARVKGSDPTAPIGARKTPKSLAPSTSKAPPAAPPPSPKSVAPAAKPVVEPPPQTKPMTEPDLHVGTPIKPASGATKAPTLVKIGSIVGGFFHALNIYAAYKESGRCWIGV